MLLLHIMPMVAGFWGVTYFSCCLRKCRPCFFLVNILVNDTFYPATLQPKVSVLSGSGVTLLSG